MKLQKIIFKKLPFKVSGYDLKGMQQMKNMSIQARILNFSKNSKHLWHLNQGNKEKFGKHMKIKRKIKHNLK